MTMTGTAEPIDYEELVESYNNRLLNQLRSHAIDHAFLEMWVPDEDPVTSILNMVEAAEAYGAEGFTLRLGRETLSAEVAAALIEAIGAIATVESETKGDHGFVHISAISC
jgi:hypothetical protein